MKLQVYSDLHLEFESLSLASSNADVIVLAGDIHIGDKGVLWALETFPDRPVIYVLGNHEFYTQKYPSLISKLKDLSQGTNVHVLEKSSVEIDGVAFHGSTLWTDFALFGDPRVAGYECQQVMRDFKKIRKEPGYSKLRSIDVAMIHAESLRWLEESLQNSPCTRNVVVTHHAPSLLSAPDEYKGDIVTAAYASNLDDFVTRMGPDLWIHGHMHNQSDYQIGRTRIICNPRGYPSEWHAGSMLKTDWIIEV